MSKGMRKGSRTQRGMDYISALFTLERGFADLTPEKRCQKRLEKSKPVSDAFFAWTTGLGALSKSHLGEAVGYALSQKQYLENIYLGGRADFTNNRVERSIKPFVMGRKAWLFSNTPPGKGQFSHVFHHRNRQGKRPASLPPSNRAVHSWGVSHKSAIPHILCPTKDIKLLMADLKRVYQAVDEQTALYELDQFEEKWSGRYPKIAISWRQNWANLATYFKYPQEVRTLIYN